MTGLLLRNSSVLHPTAKAAAELLSQRGAILTLAADPTHRLLLGDLRWHQDAGVFLFVAFGDDERDARYLRVDAITEERDGRVSFFCDEVECAKLQQIAAAGVDDPDDYHIAWQLWQQVAPLRRTLIDRCFARLAPNHDPHRCNDRSLGLV